MPTAQLEFAGRKPDNVRFLVAKQAVMVGVSMVLQLVVY